MTRERTGDQPRSLSGHLHDVAVDFWESHTATMATVQLDTDVAPPSQSLAEQVQTWVSADRQHFCAASAGHEALPDPLKVALIAPVAAH